jgi:serine/threonine protein kinase
VSEAAPHPGWDLPATAALAVDRICSAFEDAWQAGRRPRLEDFLRGADATARGALLGELLRVDLAYRRRAGERPAAAEYAEHCPDDEALVAEVFRQEAERGGAVTRSRRAEPTGRGDDPAPGAAPPWPAVPGYEILEVLGRGGMGVVYKALQVSARRLVALKMIRDGALAGPEHRARFAIDVEATARFEHEYVVRIYEVGEHDGLPFFSMQLAEGGSLDRKLEGGQPPPHQAARLVRALADAVQHAHEKNIVHRDLKPANVLLRADGRPLVTDFGLAKRLDRDTRLPGSRTVMGTAEYMAPEQARGDQPVGPASDVYGLGAILYELLAGRPPFAGASWEAVIRHVLDDDPWPPSRIRRGVPPDLEAVCLKCLEKDPTKRYPSARALAEDLDCFLDGRPMAVRPLSEWERQCRWALRVGYELAEVVGWSALGMVYRARQMSLGRRVLLKTISVCSGADEDLLVRFRAEAETAAQVDHPNIQKIYDLGLHDGQAYLSQEHVDGGTLADRVNGVPMAPREAAGLIEAVARAVHCAHQKGIVHTDLRPFNVLVAADGVAKITGFGLSRLLGGDPADCLPVRRVFSNYIAPEQASPGGAGAVGAAADIHALGAMLYELLTGRPPFLGDTVAETLEQIRARPADSPSKVNRALPRWFDAICLRCLEKNPARRYASAEELADALRPFRYSELTKTEEFELVPGYAFEEELGRGGTTVVYRARQMNLNRPVALKVFRANFSQILDVNRAVARLNHPNVVQVYDCGERDGLLYVAEEYVDGTRLDRVIGGKPRPPREAAGMVLTLARALHHIHRAGIVHRNLKPRVVLLTAAGVPKVSSFDLALLAGHGPPASEVENATIVGTPRYLAPEQARGLVRAIGPATDIHGLGAILYELLTGRPPFDADNLSELVRMVSFEPPVPPRRQEPAVPPFLEAVCLRCLQKQPAGRYPDAGALADELDRYLAGRRRWPLGAVLGRQLRAWLGRPT